MELLERAWDLFVDIVEWLWVNVSPYVLELIKLVFGLIYEKLVEIIRAIFS